MPLTVKPSCTTEIPGVDTTLQVVPGCAGAEPVIFESTEQSFTAECEEGMIGEPVTVTKVAGAYTSEVSQEDADGQALAAATTEAQSALVCEPDPLFNGLIHAWMLNEGSGPTSPDRVGSEDLTLRNGAAWDTVAGEAGVTLDGISQYLDSDPWLVGNTTGITVVVWVYYTAGPINAMIVDKEPVNGTWQIYFSGPTLLGLCNTTFGGSGGRTDGTPDTNGWHQFALAAQAGENYLYVDGVPVGIFSGSQVDVADANTVFNVGRYSGAGGGYYFSGTIGPIYVYDRMLSAGEIGDLYATKYLF